MPTGIVLGGGGTLGDFQVGALRFLYEKRILPDIKCVSGTSIGAINAVIVSTGKDCDKRLQRYWSEDVIGRGDLIPQHTWSEDIVPMLKAFILSEKRSRLSIGRLRLIERIWAIADFLQQSKEDSFRDIIRGINDLADVFETAIRESTLYKADNLKQRMLDKIDDLQKALDPEIVFCLYATNLETGQKTCFTNNAQLVGIRGDTLYVQCHSSSMLVEAALASAAVPVMFPPVAVKFPHGEMCGKYYIDGSARDIVPIKGAIACKADKIYAILCFPRFAKKRKYAFLDLKDAKGKIVSTDMYTSNLLDIQPGDWVVNNRDWNPMSDECDVIDVANRTAAIVLDEMTEGDLIATDEKGNIAKDALGKKIEPIVIDPLIPVHGMTQLSIGLIKINADQGFMRAFDVLCAGSTPIEQLCEELTAEITVRRIKIWALEHKLIERVSEVRNKSHFAVSPLWDGSLMSYVMRHCSENVVDTKIILDIRQMKKELKECIDRRLDIVDRSSLSPDDKQRCLPKDYVCMYMCWEPHNWSVEGKEETPLISTPWHKLDLGELGSDVIEEDRSLGQPPVKCKSRSLLSFGVKSYKVKVV
ncbi:MAG TPA: patatin-like phospholipase family protein [archaeon]